MSYSRLAVSLSVWCTVVRADTAVTTLEYVPRNYGQDDCLAVNFIIYDEARRTKLGTVGFFRIDIFFDPKNTN